MVEIISSILEAEKKADEIIKVASDNAKQILINGEAVVDTIREDAVNSFKEYRKTVIANAESEAEKQYLAKVAEGETVAKTYAKEAEKKAESIAENIFKEIVG